MKKFLFLLFFSMLAQIPSASANPEEPKKLPSLGSCGDDTGYFIKNCIPFKCRLPIGDFPNTYREMEIVGYEGAVCIHKFASIIRNPKYPAVDFRTICKLSEAGREEVANQFISYQKGNLTAYTSPVLSKDVSKECIMQ